MLKRYLVSGLKPGMYVVDPGLREHDNQLYVHEGLIESPEHVKSLLGQGFEEAYIDTDKGAYFTENTAEKDKMSTLYSSLENSIFSRRPKSDQKVDSLEEAQRAEEMYTDSLAMLKDLYEDIQLGKNLNMETSSQYVDQVLQSIDNNSDALTALVKFKCFDDYSYSHSLNVAIYAVGFGRFLGLDEGTVKVLGLSGLFHDLGKLKIPLHILNKPEKLTDEEFETMQRHPEFSCAYLRKVQGLNDDISRAVYEHHEKVSGKGYPTRKRQNEISNLGMILAHVDVYDALTSRRPWKEPMPQSQAMSVIYSMRGKDFLPAVTDRFIQYLGAYPVGTLVKLKSGESAVIFAQNHSSPLKPSLKILGENGEKYPEPLFVDLADEMFQDDEDYEIVEALSPIEHEYDLKDFFA